MEQQPLPKERLLAQGQCCGLGCLNCPYAPKHTRGSIKINTALNFQ